MYKFIKNFYYKNWIQLLDKVPLEVDKGKENSICFILQNKNIIKSVYGVKLLKTIILNHRSHFNPDKKNIVLKMYDELVYFDFHLYTSHLAITLNILNNFDLNEKERSHLIDNIKYYIKGNYSDKLLIQLAKEKIKK